MDLDRNEAIALKVLKAPPMDMDTEQYTDWYRNLKREVETLYRLDPVSATLMHAEMDRSDLIKIL